MQIFSKSSVGIQGVIKAAIDIDVTVFLSSELFICISSCYKQLIQFEKISNNLTSLRGHIKRDYEPGVSRSKRLRNESTSEIATSELVHNVCTESVRSGGTRSIPGPTICASVFGPIMR